MYFIRFSISSGGKKLFKKHSRYMKEKDWANGRKYSVWFIRWEFLKAQLFRFYDEYYHFSRLIILTVDGSSTLSWLRWTGGRTKISIRMESILCNCSGWKWEQRKWNKKKNLIAFFSEKCVPYFWAMKPQKEKKRKKYKAHFKETRFRRRLNRMTDAFPLV